MPISTLKLIVTASVILLYSSTSLPEDSSNKNNACDEKWRKAWFRCEEESLTKTCTTLPGKYWPKCPPIDESLILFKGGIKELNQLKNSENWGKIVKEKGFDHASRLTELKNLDFQQINYSENSYQLEIRLQISNLSKNILNAIIYSCKIRISDHVSQLTLNRNLVALPYLLPNKSGWFDAYEISPIGLSILAGEDPGSSAVKKAVIQSRIIPKNGSYNCEPLAIEFDNDVFSRYQINHKFSDRMHPIEVMGSI